MLELLAREALIKVYAGAMYSDKTKGLVEEIKAYERSGLFPYQGFKPLIDKRYGTHRISTRFAMPQKGADELHEPEPVLWIDATPIRPNRPEDIIALIRPETKVVAIDEAQFFGRRIVDVTRHLKDDLRISVVIATLDLNFRGEPFGAAPELLAYADKVIKGESFCHCESCSHHPGAKCLNIGNRTQRLVFGKPAPYDDPLVYVERDRKNLKRTYQLRCEECFVVPGKPSPLESIAMSRARYHIH